jgi:hypothetical protein
LMLMGEITGGGFETLVLGRPLMTL